MGKMINPFKPGAGHQPPYLAGREKEKDEFKRLLKQEIILENMVLTGLRGVGKTVLLETLKPLAIENKWLWVGTDLSESTSINEDNLVKRLIADLSSITSSIPIESVQHTTIGFGSKEKIKYLTLDYTTLISVYEQTPGLAVDKIKTVLELSWSAISQSDSKIRGIVFAYDEAQNLADHQEKEQFPMALLLDTFQSLQRKELPLMLALTGLPTLFPKLVDSRTFAERMFHIVDLEKLEDADSREAITKPIKNSTSQIVVTPKAVDKIVEMSGGYPYFIQFICKEVFDLFIQLADKGEEASIPAEKIEQKLDADFFAGRWARATDRQRDLMFAIASLKRKNGEFTVQEVVKQSKAASGSPFSSSHVNQMLVALASQGLVFKNRYGKYSFAIPLLGEYILRQKERDE
ncbi:MAG: ATP-binding protein [Thermodesulfobacteriota bacterium]